MTRWFAAIALAAALGVAFATETGPKGYITLLGAVVMAVAGVAVVAFQISRPFVGIAALMATSVALPLHVGSRGQANAPLALAGLICVCWLVQEVAVLKRLRVVASPLVGTLLALMAAAVISLFAGQVSWYSSPGAPITAQIGGLTMFLLSGGIALAVGHQLRSVTELRKLTYLFLAAGSIVPFLMLSPGFDVVARPTIAPYTIGGMFWVWFVGMAAAHSFFDDTISPQARLWLLLVVGVSLFHGMVQQRDWASGWLPPLVAVVVIGAIRFPRIAVCGAAVGAATGTYFVQKAISSMMVDEAYSLRTRLDAWHTLWSIIKESPVFGVGLANYYHYTEHYSTTGWYVKFSSHNNYIDLAAQTGFVGLLLFLGFGLAALILVFRLKAEAVGGFERAYTIGSLGCVTASLASGMFGDWIIPFVYNIGLQGFRSSILFWIFVGGALAMWRLREEEQSAPEENYTEVQAPLEFEPGFAPLRLERPF